MSDEPLPAAAIEELERLEREATAGPWKACGCGRCGLVWSLPLDTCVGNASGQPDPPELADVVQLTSEQQAKNAELVAAIRNNSAALIAAARRVAELPDVGEPAVALDGTRYWRKEIGGDLVRVQLRPGKTIAAIDDARTPEQARWLAAALLAAARSSESERGAR